MTAWTTFWLCVIVFIVCDCIVALHGVDSFFWQFKTPAEQAIQKHLGGTP